MSDLPPVTIQLVANGLEGVTAAFKTIEDRARSMEAAMSNLQKQGEQARTSSARTGSAARVSAKDREYAALVKQTEKWGREEVNAEKRKNQQLEADAKRSAGARAGFFNKVASNTVSSMQRVAGTAMRLAGAVAAIGGGFTVADALGSQVKSEGMAQQIALQSGGTTTKKEVLGKADALSVGQGFTREDSLAGIDQFIAKTGNSKMALETIGQLGELANATGSDLKDLATAAGLAFNSDTTMSAEKLMKIMRQLAAQGRAGALDMRDLAGSLNRITASANQFKGDLFTNINTLGGMAQLSMSKGTSVSAAEATESVASLAMDIPEEKHQKIFNAKGVKTKDENGLMLGPDEIVRNAVVATKGDRTQLEKMFGRRSFRAVEGYANVYQKSYAESKVAGKSDTVAQQSGLDAAEKMLHYFTDLELSRAQVSKEAGLRKAEADKQLTMVFEELKIKVGEALIPKLMELIPAIKELIPSVAKLMGSFVQLLTYVTQNPLKAIMEAVGVMIMANVAKAFAVDAITKAMTASGPIGLAVAAITVGTITAQAIIDEEKSAQRDKGKAAAAKDEEDLTTLQKRADEFAAKARASRKVVGIGADGKPIFESNEDADRVATLAQRAADTKRNQISDKVFNAKNADKRLEELRAYLPMHPTDKKAWDEFDALGGNDSKQEQNAAYIKAITDAPKEAEKAALAQKDAAIAAKEAAKSFEQLLQEVEFKKFRDDGFAGPPKPSTDGTH